MDALMAALVAALAIHATDRTPWLAATLAKQYPRPSVVAGMAIGFALVNALAAAGGLLVAPHLTPNASALFLAISLGAAALGNVGKMAPLDDLSAWRVGGFGRALVGSLALGLGAAQFVVAGIVARTPLPIFAVVGATIGGIAVVAMGAGGGPRLARRLRRRSVRAAIGFALLLAAVIAALSALRLI